VNLSFDAESGPFEVTPVVGEKVVSIHLDMVDPGLLPATGLRDLVAKGESEIADDPWDREILDGFLETLLNAIDTSGMAGYDPRQMAPYPASSPVPRIAFAPMLFLRKQNTRGLTELLKGIAERIDREKNLPPEFLKLIEEQAPELPETSEQKRVSEAGEIYFPFPANEEQQKITHQLDHNAGVLVQGPPGTGKSHTIANLICHLLATGQRVLVTAKNARALAVLVEKLPADLRQLCIFLLGNNQEERRSLENSVNGLLRGIDEMDEAGLQHEISRKEAELRGLREEKAGLENTLRDIREQETRQQHICEGRYQGTAAAIARQLGEEKATFGWFADPLPPGAPFPLSPDDLQSLFQALQHLSSRAEAELSLPHPDPQTDVPSPAQLEALLQRGAQLKAAIQALRVQPTITWTPKHAEDLSNRIRVRQTLRAFRKGLRDLQQKNSSWASEALSEILRGRAHSWLELLETTEQEFESLPERVKGAERLVVSLPEELDSQQVYQDARAIRTHLEAGSGLGNFLFKPKEVREHGDFLSLVRVNGQSCKTAEPLGELIRYLEARHQLDYLWGRWEGILNMPRPEAMAAQLSLFKETFETLQQAFRLADDKAVVESLNRNRTDFHLEDWSDPAALEAALEQLKANILQLEQWQLDGEWHDWEKRFEQWRQAGRVHPIAEELQVAFRNRAVAAYQKNFDALNRLQKQVRLMQQKNDVVERLARQAPQTAAAIRNYRLQVEQLKSLNGAWYWAQGNSWLKEFQNNDADSLTRNLKRAESDIGNLVAGLASLKAWQFALHRMSDDHKTHLKAFRKAMDLIGGGFGKNVHRHRLEAQRHLSACQEAVPAWVMPLQRLYDTAKPEAGSFDVIIIDEASQCGLDALVLFYLGKKVLVVGDDQQISPDMVGLNKDIMLQKQGELLRDFEYYDAFNTDNSLFDQARMRIHNPIQLREHFRCVPEIIAFSNRLCYQNEPLLPLRQVPQNRLEALKSTFVKTGFRQGRDNRVVNVAEMEALVAQIEKCGKDPRYQGKTFGVITLLGTAQEGIIEEKLIKTLGVEEMERRRLICGDAYDFQGDERDVIFLSMVAAPNERNGVFTSARDRRRFNVAASRARDQMWLFHSIRPEDLSGDDFRRQLLLHFRDYRPTPPDSVDEVELGKAALRADRRLEKPPAPFDSWFEVDVALEILKKGFHLRAQVEFARHRLDLVISGEKAQMAVECDGDHWHGMDRYQADLARQRKLERAGWRFFRVRESYFYADRQASLRHLWPLLAELGISPGGISAAPEIDIEADRTRVPNEPDGGIIRESVSGHPNGTSPVSAPGHTGEISTEQLARVIIKTLSGAPDYRLYREELRDAVVENLKHEAELAAPERFSPRVEKLVNQLIRKNYLIVPAGHPDSVLLPIVSKLPGRTVG
ncbi:MAG TPA: AAA domain-containing protein, partial [Calditrichia bacterium]|nr:AAA domain-containing protein [Calditrichia bacterium]